jgi:hypothetical protein
LPGAYGNDLKQASQNFEGDWSLNSGVLVEDKSRIKPSSALEEKNQVSEAQPSGYQMQQQVGTQVGHVSLHAAANLPEKIILPAYPAVAWQKNVQGRVTLKALISKDGRLRIYA